MLPLRDGLQNIVLLPAGLQDVGGGVGSLLLDGVMVVAVRREVVGLEAGVVVREVALAGGVTEGARAGYCQLGGEGTQLRLLLLLLEVLVVVSLLLLLLVMLVMVERPGRTLLNWLLILSGSALKYLFEVLDVVHGLVEDVHFRHFLHHGCGGDVSSEDLKPSVDSLHSVSLSLIPLDCLQVLGRLDGVPVDGMYGH